MRSAIARKSPCSFRGCPTHRGTRGHPYNAWFPGVAFCGVARSSGQRLLLEAPKGPNSKAQGAALGTGPILQTIQGPTGRNNGPRNANATRQRVTVRWTLKFLHGPPSQGCALGFRVGPLRGFGRQPLPRGIAQRLASGWGFGPSGVAADGTKPILMFPPVCVDIARFCAAHRWAISAR